MQVNEYFDGNVKSIGFENPEGRVTAGVMAPGEYQFGTSEKERMVITSGAMAVKLPGQSEFTRFKSGEEFNVDADVNFDVQVECSTAYLCFYS